MLAVSAKLALEFLSSKFSPVILVDTFSGDKIIRFLEIVESQIESSEIRIFGLYTSDEELRHRLDLRDENEFRDFVICQRLNGDLQKWKSSNEVQIDTTGLVASETAERIISYLFLPT